MFRCHSQTIDDSALFLNRLERIRYDNFLTFSLRYHVDPVRATGFFVLDCTGCADIAEHAMHTSVVKLRPENIVEVAKDVIRPAGWHCEWNIAALQKPVQCRIVLNSWSAYLQHLIRHCQQIKGSGGGLACRLPRCNIPSGISIPTHNELVHHIQQSHLSRAQLTCPIRDCSSFSFSRPALMENHFREMHPDLINQEVSLSSPLLLPIWRPFRPDHPTVPSHLPQSVPPGSGLILPIKGTPRSIFESQDSQLSQLSQWSRDDEGIMGSQPQLLSPRKKRPKQIDAAQYEEVTEESTFVFDDLPVYDDHPETVSLIRRKGPPLDVARPQDILDPKEFGYRVYKGTILYDSFVRIHGLESADETEEEKEG